jgi:choline dehydrogenase-like flavoprotein
MEAAAERPDPGDEHGPLTRQETRLRVLLLAHAAWSAVLAIGYLAGGDTATLGFMANSFAKDVLFVVLSLLAAAHIRRHGWLTLAVVAGYVGLVLGEAVTLIVGGSPDQDVLGLFTVSSTVALLAWMAVDLVLIVWFTAWWIAAVRARWGLRYLHPVAFLSLLAVAEVLIEGDREVVPPRDVARNVDAYLARLDARGKGRVQVALAALAVWPVFTARPPLPALDPIRRKHYLERRFIHDIAKKRTFAPLRPLLQAAIRTGSQMSYLGYYGDRRSWPSIGYKPYRERANGRAPARTDHREPALRSLTAPPQTRYDSIVIGSGAAGGLLAYRFAEAGRRVLVLERGPHVDPRRFTDDEVDQYLRLYNEGALQLATDFRLQVLQGMCVGGGTTINNALCLDPPGAILDSWRQHGIDRAALEQAIAAVRDFLPVGPIDEAKTTSVAARRFADAATALRLPGRVELMEVNISEHCVGCGYCNIGCAYGAKLSMLDTVLPWAQRDFPGRLDVLPDFEATRIVHEGDRAIAVRGRYAGEEIDIPAGEITVAAGAVHSSYLLQRSEIGGDDVGRGLHFNINSPLTADFPDHVDAFAGIQMSHAYVPGNGVPDYLVETWFNPPATQALSMPGWFGRHFENMLRYRHMACGGTLVGTTQPGLVRPTRSGPEIRYEPSKTDLQRLVDGLKTMGRIFLAAGAERVMPATYAWHEFRDAAALDDLDSYVEGNADILLTSAHPQGGNAIGSVVDPDFRVHGFRNLYLCDASVFPSSVHVNPQLTVMGMAQLAARTILDPARKVSAS